MRRFNPLRWWRRRRLARQICESRVPQPLWQLITRELLAHYHLNPRERLRLRRLSGLFLARKRIVGAGGMMLDERRCGLIAAQACLPILALDLRDYDGWSEVIVYPDAFIVRHEEPDRNGLIHEHQRVLSGEAWSRGPLILSWRDARPSARRHHQGSNVVIHECAHKLDMQNGVANGMPPLHRDMDRHEWTRVFTASYRRLLRRIERHRRTPIDPYAAESPAEFFAVVSEEFFEQPVRLHQAEPRVYRQLRLYYRQDPLGRVLRSRHWKPGHGPAANSHPPRRIWL